MENNKTKWLVIPAAIVSTLPSSPASADEGPLFAPLQVVRMYVDEVAPRIYVEFTAGAMPSCYNNSGGILSKNHPHFSLIYSQLLAMSAMDGMKGKVLFAQEGSSGWGACRIVGLDTRP